MTSRACVRRLVATFLILPPSFLILLASGCGGSGGPVCAPVAGTVNFRGQALPQGDISFHPNDGQRPAYGRIQDGKIVDVTTLDQGDGVPVGPCKVAVKAVQAAADMYTPSKSLIPERYADPNKSGLTADIQKGQTNQVQYDLTD